MVAQLEHMQADYTAALDEGGVEIVIDGNTIQVFRPPVETTPSEFERAVLVRQKIVHLTGVIPKKVPGEVVTVDGLRWEVVNHTDFPLASVLILQRSQG